MYSPKPWKRQVFQSLVGLLKRLLVEALEVEGEEEEEERVEELGQQRQMGRLMVKSELEHYWTGQRIGNVLLATEDG